MSDRDELNQLREIARMHELEAKAGGQSPASGQPPADPYASYMQQERQQPAGTRLKHFLMGDSASPVVQGSAPAALPAEMVPMLGKVGEALTSSASRRIATGAVQGAASDPEHPVWGGTKGALMAAGGEALAGALGVGGKIAKWTGGKLTALKDTQANAYADNPELADQMSQVYKESPQEFSDMVKDQAKGALVDGPNSLYEKSSQPLLDAKGQKIAGLNVRVQPQQYQGTAAGQEMERAWNAKGNTVDQWQPEGSQMVSPKVESSPLNYEWQSQGKQLVNPEVRATPVDTQTNYGPSDNQSTPMPGYAPSAPVRVSSVNPQIAPVGPEQVEKSQTLAELFARKPVPSAPQTEIPEINVPVERKVQAPAPMPDQFSITGPQALRANRASMEAAAHKEALNPLGYSPADEPEAIAAAHLRKALSDQDPALGELNDQLSQNARYSAFAKRTLSTNPTKLLDASEGVGNVPMRALREHLDQHTGSNLEQLAQALDAGRAMNDSGRHMGLVDRLIAHPAGKAMLSNVGAMQNASGAINDSSNATLQSILNAMYGGSDSNRK